MGLARDAFGNFVELPEYMRPAPTLPTQEVTAPALPEQEVPPLATAYQGTAPLQMGVVPDTTIPGIEEFKAGFAEEIGKPIRAWKSFEAGVEDVYNITGSSLEWIGAEGAGEAVKKFGGKIEAEAPEYVKGDVYELLDPDYYATRVTRAIPFSLSLIPLMVLGGVGGGALAGALGLGQIGSWLLTSLGAVALSRPAESVLEAGAAYQEAKDRGMPDAQEIGNEVFRKNLALAGMDAVEMSVALMPTPSFVPKNLVKKGLVRVLTMAGKTFIVGLSEGGEEVYQEMIAARALGDEFYWNPEKWTPETAESFRIGMIMGGAMGLAGDVITNVRGKAGKALPQNLAVKLGDYIEEAKSKGLSQSEAEIEGLNKIAETPEGAKVIQDAIAEVKSEVTPKAEGAVPVAEEVAPVTEKVTPVTPEVTAPVAVKPVVPVVEPAVKAEIANVSIEPKDKPLFDAVDNIIKDYITKRGEVSRYDIPLHKLAQQAGIKFESQEMVDFVQDVMLGRYGFIEKGYGAGWAGGTGRAPKAKILSMYKDNTTGKYKLYDAKAKASGISAATHKIEGTHSLLYLTDKYAIERGLQSPTAKPITPTVAKPVTEEVKAEVIPEEVAKPEVSKAELSKKRQSIMALSKVKGFSKKQLFDIQRAVAGKSAKEKQLPFHLTKLTAKQLDTVFKKVEEARPVKIKSKTVITKKTERNIQSLKTNLTTAGKMNDAHFNRFVEILKLPAVKYESAKKFITESQGKDLIRTLLRESEFVGEEITTEDALGKKPDIAGEVSKIGKRAARRKAIEVLGKPVVKTSPAYDAEYYGYEIQAKTGVPIGDAYNILIRRYSEANYKVDVLIERLVNSTPAFNTIANNEVALKRVEDYLASNKGLEVEMPEDITPDEVKLAKEMESHFEGFRDTVRFLKFWEAYYTYKGDTRKMVHNLIPDAPVTDLRKAIDIYESKGEDALKTFLATKDWGVIKSGYNPLSIISPKIYLHRLVATTLGKGHIQVRQGALYQTEDVNILHRYRRYIRQVTSLNELQSPIRHFIDSFEEAAPQMVNARGAGSNFARAINQMKGYRETGGPLAQILRRLYAQTAAVVFWRPHLAVRNIMIQNLGFNPDRLSMFKLSTYKPLSGQDLVYFKTYIDQTKGIMHDLLMAMEKPFLGLGRLTRFARKTSGYSLSDKVNRMLAYTMRKTKVLNALEQYESDKDMSRLLNDSGLYDLLLEQQQHALKLLARDKVNYNVPGLDATSGEEAFARYIAEKTVKAIHFTYDRALRAPTEVGPTGEIVGNLLVYPRSYFQRLYLQARKLDPNLRATQAEKTHAARSVAEMVIIGTLVGELYRRLTGLKKNPGNPINILTWTPGGLLLGAAINISKLVGDIFMAITGDKDAQGRLPTEIPLVADVELPFYKILVQVAETIAGKKNVDRLFLRHIRAMIDKEYKVREDMYNVDRNFVEMMQHALFGGEPSEEVTMEEKEKRARDDLLNLLSQSAYNKNFKDLSDAQKDVILVISPE